MSPSRTRRRFTAAAAALGLLAAPLAVSAATTSATATPAGDDLVLNEVYGGGGNSGATYTHDFVELYNPTEAPIALAGRSLQYRSAAGGLGGVHELTGQVPAGSTYLVQLSAGNGGTTPLPTPDDEGTLNLSGTNGQVYLADSTGELPYEAGDTVGDTDVVDMVGYGSADAWETAAAARTSNSTSVARTDGADSDDNSADLTTAAPTPEPSGGDGGGGDEPQDAAIAEIQGTGDASPLVDRLVRTRGVVTAAYPTGGFDGFHIQTEGTGGALDPATHDASDGVFVYGSAATGEVQKGDFVEVTGTVKEFFGLTEVSTTGASDVQVLSEPHVAPKPATLAWPRDDAEREDLEGMLLDPQGPFTVSNTFPTNRFAEIGLASGETPLLQPTEVARPGSPVYDAAVADNDARSVTLDDGSSANYTTGSDADVPLPWLTGNGPVRVNAPVDFVAPVVVDYRFSQWRLQPTAQLTADDANGVLPSTFANTRTEAPEAVGGDVTLGTFNVLNYFTTTGEDFEASGQGTCSYYTDRDGNRITTNRCDPDGPRGAADQVNLERQQAKIVSAINALDADVVSLEEIENSVRFGRDRDAALSTLTDALNADAGAGTWEYVPSPGAADLPPVEEQDVIRTAFLYQPDAVEPVGDSVVLDDAAFANARDPLAQAFRPLGGTELDTFAAIVNHFKSKGSGSGDDADQGDGQGASNASRVRQARALAGFADDFSADRGLEKVFLTGDFNAYSQEDPMQVLYDAGYAQAGSDTTDEWSYSFGGQSGSLDHVLANEAAGSTVTGADIWEINAGESVALEYSRFNNNVTDFYAPDPYRASDHDPFLVGIALDPERTATTTTAWSRSVRAGEPGWVVVRVSGADGPATGEVALLDRAETLDSTTLRRGHAVLVFAPDVLGKGKHRLVVEYAGDRRHAPSADRVTVKVKRDRGRH